MSSRRLTFDASRPSTRNLGASPAARNTLLSTSQSPALLSPTRGLATPTRAAQRASLSRLPQSGSLGRRNPLQAITEKERERSNHQQQHRITTPNATPRGAASGTDVFKIPHQANENLAPLARSAAYPTPEQQREQKARIAEWVFAYRRAFPSFVFYFEGVDENTVRRLAAPIRVLGAKVETFFSAQAVTHVIVDDISKINDENGAGSSHVVSLAKRFQLKIWDLTKLETRILAYILPGYNDIATQSPSIPSVKRKLNEAFSAEKMYAMRHKTFEGTSVAHSVDFYYFKYYYVLVEDGTHLNRPAIMEDYRPPEPGNDPPWPKLYMVPKGRCPFIQYDDPTTSSKGSESDPEYNKENMTPEPDDTLPTAHLLSKTPASRVNTPRRKTWAPSVVHPAANGQEAATPPEKRPRYDSDDEDRENMHTPTRPSRLAPRAPLGMPPAFASAAASATRGAGGGVHSSTIVASMAMDSNASGIGQSHGVTSTSTAFNVNALDPVMQQSLLQNLNGGRVTHLSKLEQPVAGPRVAGAQPTVRKSGRLPPAPRFKKARVPARRPVVAKRGYCENCHAKFEDMMEHIKSPQHLRFANNDRNWLELDSLLERVKRPLKKPQSALQSNVSDYAALVLSSDDGSSIPQTPAVANSATHRRALNLASGDAATTVSAPASIGANWSIGTPIHRSLIPSYMATSTQMLASGRLSTETVDNTDTAAVTTMTTPAPNRHRGTRVSGGHDIIDLSFSNSNTNSSCVSPRPLLHGDHASDSRKHSATSFATPAPRRGTTDTSNSIEALVSSLETPDFRENSFAQQCDEATTLVGSRLDRYSRQSHLTPNGKHAAALETPTRNNALNILDGATLNRPNRTGIRLLPEHAKFEGSDEPLVNTIHSHHRLLHSENESF
ncbi:Cdc7p-Dbf4p kinase complex regulatory subunit [Coemansia sp. RSA 1813]|nr:Cdc7p-Dbf4p kinase complex regulatory subunit [Coemansia sp. RSA 1646]KAJ1773251.1 Cdc7p-Dbf4p kinase complex regulatory subunit [Coemansia sp. RSA 1843]KAJ2092718.1 Cdc7p-Dbf4p kinase complex regulatory subunit [Coemansia sp. RSA 986]KAJ2217784.1 Cdc7p-Dbf4p kinase complex regulatory subunit [Coemansia sp. RSA 487]KAJ2572980.1 Cdc7p-Dbf4p kinase complex regulatory subunit [Coemansia sp. RSA 1813]